MNIPNKVSEEVLINSCIVEWYRQRTICNFKSDKLCLQFLQMYQNNTNSYVIFIIDMDYFNIVKGDFMWLIIFMNIKLLICADNDNITGGPPRELSTLFPGRQGKGDCLPCNFCPWLRKMVYLKETRRMTMWFFRYRGRIHGE